MNIFLACTIIALLANAEGCHYGKRADRRRGRRNVVIGRQDLSDIFTECMERKSPPDLIPDMRSVVNFAIEHTLWYKVSDTYFCKKNKDTFGCWQGIMDLLVDWDSRLLGPARECVLEYSSKKRRGGGFKRKRQAVNAKQQSRGRSILERTCPGVTDADYGECLGANYNGTGAQPTLAYYDFDSIAIFIKQHLSRCRLKTFNETWNNNNIGYKRDCGHTRFRGPNGEKLAHADEQCLPLLLLHITKEESPLKQDIEFCNLKYTNTTVIDDPGELKVGNQSKNEKETYDEQGLHGGSDIIGYCPPEANFTIWFDQFNPNGTGDRELLSEIRGRHPGEIMCETPTGIQMRVTDTNKPYFTSGNRLNKMSQNHGLECVDAWQREKKCENFKVRFCCLDSEDAEERQHKYPKTKDTVGTCERSDQWSSWVNTDRKQRDGELELFAKANLSGCDPVAVQGRIAKTKRPYTEAYNNFEIEDPAIGITCPKKMQPREKPCRDLEVESDFLPVEA